MKRLGFSFILACIVVAMGMRLVPPRQLHRALHEDPEQTNTVLAPLLAPAVKAETSKAPPDKHSVNHPPATALSVAASKAEFIDAGTSSDQRDAGVTASISGGAGDGAGRQVIIDEEAAVKIESWLQRGDCALTVVGSPDAGLLGGAASMPSTSNDRERAMTDSTHGGMGIRIEANTPLGLHLAALAAANGQPLRSEAVVLWFPPGLGAEGDRETGTLRLACGEHGRPRLVYATTSMPK